MKKKKPSRKLIVKKLDKVFSQWIRAKHMSDSGYIECYTCETRKPFNEIQAGHFMSRRSYATRWQEDPPNVMPQCQSCNIFSQGKSWEFGQRLDRDFGQGTANSLYHLSKTTIKFTNQELLDKIDEYQEKLSDLNLL